jgi:hypothetical protein
MINREFIVKILKTAFAFAALALAGSASAAPIVLGSGWQGFTFNGVGSSFSQSFEVTVAAPATFQVTDAFNDGDRFEIFINGTSFGLTSVPTNDRTNIGANYDAAFASPLFSHGSYALGAGTYTITGLVTLSPYGSGGAAARLVDGVSAVPEPATWAMLIFGFGAIAVSLRSAKRRSDQEFNAKIKRITEGATA